MTSPRALVLLALTAPTSAFLQRLAKLPTPPTATPAQDHCEPFQAEPLHPLLASANVHLVRTLKGAIDHTYAGRDIARFYLLETIARVPYFSYMSCLHLYESFGMRTSVDLMRTHYAEADNELHHLLIMEALGGSDAFAMAFAHDGSAPNLLAPLSLSCASTCDLAMRPRVVTAMLP